MTHFVVVVLYYINSKYFRMKILSKEMNTMSANKLIEKYTKSEVFYTLLYVLKQDSNLKVLYTENNNIFCVPRISDIEKLNFGKSEYHGYIAQFHFTISENPIQINYEILIIPAKNSEEEEKRNNFLNFLQNDFKTTSLNNIANYCSTSKMIDLFALTDKSDGTINESLKKYISQSLYENYVYIRGLMFMIEIAILKGILD